MLKRKEAKAGGEYKVAARDVFYMIILVAVYFAAQIAEHMV